MLFHYFLKLFDHRDGQHISMDLSWIFMPTWLHVGLIFRLLVHLGASRSRLGASWHVLGRLGATWAGLGVSWEVLGHPFGGVLGRLGRSWDHLGVILGYLGLPLLPQRPRNNSRAEPFTLQVRP